MKKYRWWIVALTIILTGALCAGNSFAKEKGTIKEPKYKSPRVYTDSNGKVVFKEFVDDLTVTRIEFYDPDSGELLYGVSLQDGRLVDKREGSLVGENDGPFDESGEFIENRFLTDSGKAGLVTREYNGEMGVYIVRGIRMNNPMIVSVHLEKGRIIQARRKFLLNNELVEFKRISESDTYEETYFHNDSSDTYRKYKSGFLEHERLTIPGEVRGHIVPHIAYYLRGKHAFTIKNKFNKEKFREEVAVYDALDKLVGKASPVFGESLYLKEEVVNGRKGLQVIRREQKGKKKVEAVRFEDE